MTIKSCRETWQLMTDLTERQGAVRNFQQTIRMDDWLVETDLFPAEALEAYTAWNLEKPLSPEIRQKYFSEHRGGAQGDYRANMAHKIANVVESLKLFPASKRAVITILNNPEAHHSADDEAKCMREIHFYCEGNDLNATVFFRAQAAEIFPKNIHFIGSLMAEVAKGLGSKFRPGQLFYLATILVSDRT